MSIENRKSVWWEEDEQGAAVWMIDQTALPLRLEYLKIRHEQDVAKAIRSLRVRGAPAISFAAAFGIVLALARLLQECPQIDLAAAELQVRSAADLLRKTRPTAVNLAWAIDRLLKRMDEALNINRDLAAAPHPGDSSPEPLGTTFMASAQFIARLGICLPTEIPSSLKRMNEGTSSPHEMCKKPLSSHDLSVGSRDSSRGRDPISSRPFELKQLLLVEAMTIAQEDRDACQRMGELGADLIKDGDTVLTHCNTGALATAGIGTALAPIYIAHQAGKRIHVFVDETRPVLQGARLTAWELQRAGIPLTLITDNMAGYFMQQGQVQAVFVGADRIAANGDVANKIGTYSLAILAHAHTIPFYVVAPTSTIDLTITSGKQIPVEQRNPQEVTTIFGTQIAPHDIAVANPAFDITPHRLITAIITEYGILRAPYERSLAQAMCSTQSNHKKG